MARERFSFISEDEQKKQSLENRVKHGDITFENFKELSDEDQSKVNEILFNLASEKVRPVQSLAALEFTLFAFMRIMNKQVNGLSLSNDDIEIKESLETLMSKHDITNQIISMNQWPMDYMEYTLEKSEQILQNREEHLSRSREVRG